VPLMTFTRDWRTAAALAAPSETYLAAMATGLREAHGWSSTQIDRYLSALPGCSDRVSRRWPSRSAMAIETRTAFP